MYRNNETTPTFPDITEVHITAMKPSDGGTVDAFVCLSVKLQQGHCAHEVLTRPSSSDQTHGGVNSPDCVHLVRIMMVFRIQNIDEKQTVISASAFQKLQ